MGGGGGGGMEMMWCFNALSKHLMMVDVNASDQKSLILLGTFYFCS